MTKEPINSLKETMIPLVDAIVVGDCNQSLTHARNLQDSDISIKDNCCLWD